MNNDHIISSLNKELDDLESKIEELSNKYLDLKKENQLLKERQEIEVSEKFKIREKNAGKVEIQNLLILTSEWLQKKMWFQPIQLLIDLPLHHHLQILTPLKLSNKEKKA